MLLLSAYYLVFLYDRLSFLYFEIRNLQLGGLFFAAVNFIQLISTPVVINLLYRKQISGWILPALGKTIEGVNLLFFILLYFGRFYYFNWRGKLTVSVYLLLVTIILLLLNHKKTRRILNVSTSTQSRTLIGGIIIGIVYYLILRKIYRY